MDLEVTERGTGDELVVFVHGVLDRGSSFRRVAEQLDGECRMRWYDRRGYGTSFGAAGAPSGVDGHVDDLLAVLDGQRAVLAAHSFGGVTALGAAVRAPDLVGALVLYETVTAWAPGWDDRVMRGVLGGGDPEAAGLDLMLGHRWESLDADAKAQWQREAAAFVAEERSARAVTPPFDITELCVPVVYGASDPHIMAPVIDHLRTGSPRVEVVPVSDAGHNAHRSAPDAYADLVRRAPSIARG